MTDSARCRYCGRNLRPDPGGAPAWLDDVDTSYLCPNTGEDFTGVWHEPEPTRASAPLTPRDRPCASCPYRRDVPSGVWHASEYSKLPAYDADTSDQPPAIFMCHQDDETVCSGWLGHTDPSQLLAVRLGVATGAIDPAALDYATDVALFPSGADAAAHGVAEIDRPGDSARRIVAKIQRRRGE